MQEPILCRSGPKPYTLNPKHRRAETAHPFIALAELDPEDVVLP